MVVLAITAFGFSFKISPILPFLVFVSFSIWLFNYLFRLLPKRPELFQDSQTWLGHQRLLIGDKQRGLYELPPKTQLVQPIVQSKATSARANIRKDKTT